MVKPRPHTLQLRIQPTVAPHHPLPTTLATAGHKGVLTRDRAVEEPAAVNARNALDQKMLKVIPKAALPANLDPKLLQPR